MTFAVARPPQLAYSGPAIPGYPPGIQHPGLPHHPALYENLQGAPSGINPTATGAHFR